MAGNRAWAGRSADLGAAPAKTDWRDEITDLARAASGGVLFAVPLLYTMEMWFIGAAANLGKILVFFLLALLLNVLLNYFAGFRRGKSWLTAMHESIEASAIGLVLGLVILLVLDQVQLTDPLTSITGKVVLQSIPLSIGASIANSLFGRDGKKDRRHGDDNDDGKNLSGRHEFFNDVGATAIGGVFIGFSIAPTEEVGMIASDLAYAHLMGIIALSLIFSYTIVFVSGFQGNPTHGPFQSPLSETILCYLVSLLVALVVLYLFDQVDASLPLRTTATMTAVLGLPVTIGGAAGRLVI